MPKQKKSIRKRQPTRVTVELVRREKVDWDRYAWALLQHCRAILAEEEDKAP